MPAFGRVEGLRDEERVRQFVSSFVRNAFDSATKRGEKKKMTHRISSHPLRTLFIHRQQHQRSLDLRPMGLSPSSSGCRREVFPEIRERWKGRS